MDASVPLSITAATLAPEVVATMLARPGVSLVTFRKRTDGAMRTMLCTPMELTTTPNEVAVRNGIRLVWDMQKQEPRNVPLDSVLAVRSVSIDSLVSALQ